MIFRIIFLALCSFVVSMAYAEICEEIDYKAQNEKIIIPAYQSGRVIVGEGRAYFYNAPDEKCKIKNTFLIPGDLADAGIEYGGFIYVIYFHPVSGKETTGWLKIDRVESTGTGVGPNYNEQK